jgi:hypothetical protein
MIRGFLCLSYNSAEGQLGSFENARRLVAYMERKELFYSGS